MLGSGKEETLSDGGVEEDIFFLFSEFEDILEDIDGGGRLLQEELDGRVRHNSFSLRTLHKVLDILCDGCYSETVLTSTLDETEEELRTIFVLHDIPCFIHNKDTFAKGTSCDIPYVSEEHVHGNRTENLIEITNREDYKSFSEIDISYFGEYSRENPCYIFFKPFTDSFCSIHSLKY